jgi:DNA-binding winged helix-turn-helix (wHTH) protein
MSWRFGECELNRATRELSRQGSVVPLTPKALRLMELLLERHPAAVSRHEIRDTLWPDTVVSDSNLDSLIWELRTAIGDKPRGGALRTVRGFGYAFSGDVLPLTGTAPPRLPAAIQPRLVWGDRILPLRPGENVLGRDVEATVCLDAASVSRHHARIVVEATRAYLEDLGSKNGTRVNGETLSGARELKDGDQIRLGEVQLLFRCLPFDGPTASQGI